MSVDIAINFSNRSTTVNETNEIVDYIRSITKTDLIKQVDRICGGIPYFNFFKEGFLINDEWYSESAYFNAPGEPTFVFGIDPTYFNNTNPIFDYLNVSESEMDLSKGIVFTSKSLAESKGWDIGQNLTVAVSKSYVVWGPLLRSANVTGKENVTLGDYVDVDFKGFINNLPAFIPELADSFILDQISLISLMGISMNIVFVNYESLMAMTEDNADQRTIHGMHIVIDHDNLGADINQLITDLYALDVDIATKYPDVIINDFARTTLEDLQEKLTEYRLLIFYFSLPGLLLGLFISLYVNELTLSERKRETLVMRLRNAHQGQTSVIVIVEAVLISLIGAFLGLVLGATLGGVVVQEEPLSLENLGAINLIPDLTTESLVSAIVIALVLTIILSLLFVNEVSSQEAVQVFHSEREISRPYWSRYGIDVFLLVIVVFSIFFNAFNINPVPAFASDFYNLLVPLLTWIGLSLLLVRILSWLILKLEKPLTVLFPRFLGKAGKSVAHYVVRSRHRLIQPILIIILSLSFASTLANVTASFNDQALREARYSIGADIRIQLPNQQQLEFNTSDLRKDIKGLPGVNSITETFITLIPLGSSGGMGFGMGSFALVVAIEPEEFYNVSYWQDDFFVHQKPKDILSELNSTTGGLGFIVGFTLNYPYADGPDDPTLGPSIFKRGESFTIHVGEEDSLIPRSYNINILDVALRFPAIAEMAGRPEEEIPFLITDTRLLLRPLPGQSRALLDNINASHFFIKINEGYSAEEVVQSIDEVYKSNYPHIFELLFDTMEEHYDKIYRFGSLLTGLTQLEFQLILIVLFVILFLFLFSMMKDQQKDFAILRAIGWQDGLSIRLIWMPLVLIGLLGSILGVLLAVVTTQTYTPLLSGSFLFSFSQYAVDWSSWGVVIACLSLSLLLCFIISWERLIHSPTAELLREE